MTGRPAETAAAVLGFWFAPETEGPSVTGKPQLGASVRRALRCTCQRGVRPPHL